jgi:hypothetical protein
MSLGFQLNAMLLLGKNTRWLEKCELVEMGKTCFEGTNRFLESPQYCSSFVYIFYAVRDPEQLSTSIASTTNLAKSNQPHAIITSSNP